MKTLLPLFLALVFTLAPGSGWAEEKNGLSVMVNKTTLEKNDVRGAYSYYDRIDRKQGLKAAIKNNSFKEMPEGELIWTILVRKYYSTSVESYTGTEKLKALKAAQGVDMVFGNAEITGYNYSGTSADKDKIEWQIVIKQDGKEMIKAQSTSTFDSLAKRAVKAVPNARGGN